MEYFVNSSIEKQTIYEIYRACRLCGAGAGYKMPIIQNVVNLDTNEIELKQKIRECVQIEVHQDDKMPPLICELCVDKVNDFYEFFEMCRQTNKKTRLRLGLPPQTMPRGAPDAGDCILGITEPVFIQNSNDAVSTKNRSSKGPSSNKPEVKVKIEKGRERDARDSKAFKSSGSNRSSRRPPSPPRLTRGTKRRSEDDVSLNNLQVGKTRRHDAQKPKSILKKEVRIKVEECTMVPKLKRLRERETDVKREKELRREGQNKRVKISNSPPKTIKVVKPMSKPIRTNPLQCKVCKMVFKTVQALTSHSRIHSPGSKRVPEKKPSLKPEVKTMECSACGKHFSRMMLRVHKCAKRGGECKTCKRSFSTDQALSKHISFCKIKKKEFVVKPSLMRHVKPLTVRVARCDPLLENRSGRHYDISEVTRDYGLDSRCVYPYISGRRLRIKMEPDQYDSMVKINDEIRREFDLDENYVHWDSDDSSDSELEVSKGLDMFGKKKIVDRLSTLSLKTIFSVKFLGKVPKKLRKLKNEAPFDSILNNSDFDCDMRRGIDNIIDSLGDETAKDDNDASFSSKDGTGNKKQDKKDDDNDSLFGDEPDKPQTVTNNDFDLLFNNDCNDNSALSNSKELKGNDNDNCKKPDSNLNNDKESVDKKSDDKITPENNDFSDSSKENNDNDRVKIDDNVIKNNDSKENHKTNNDPTEIIVDVSKSLEESEDTNEVSSKDTDEVLSKQIHKHKDDFELDESKDKPKVGLEETTEKSKVKDILLNENEDIMEKDKSEKGASDAIIKDNSENKENNSSGEDQVNNESSLSKSKDIKEISTNDKIKSQHEINEPKTESKSVERENNDKLMNKHNDSLEAKDTGDGAIEINKNDLVKNSVNGGVDMDKFNMDDLEDISDTEMDDSRLMEALDAQIGESEKKTVSSGPSDTDRQKKAAELENISDGGVDG